MKKLFVFMLSMVIMCLFICNTAAKEAIVEITRYDTASLKDFSDIVNDKTIEEHGLLERRKEDEEKSLNTLAYLKEDGQNVAFVYPYDVKYTDKNGNIKDKSREIVKDGLFTTTSYKTKDNEIISYFSINNDGNVEVKTTYDDGCIISVMENRNQDNRITACKDENGNLKYSNAVDTGIHLMYEAQYNGVKEYIVIDEKKKGGNVYAFQMTFDGLFPELTESGEVLLSDSTGEILLTIPAVYAKDSSENEKYTYDNIVTLTQISKNTYAYEIIVDEEFLNSDKTVYPVYVDPSTIINNNSIEDAQVSEENPNTNYGNNIISNIGYSTSSSGKSYYTYVKFNDFPNIPHHNILSAYYQTYELSNRADNILAEVVPASAEWSETTLTWNNKPTYHNEIIAKSWVGSNSTTEEYFSEYGIYQFYISNLVRGWVQGLPNYGIVIKCSYNTGRLYFATSEHFNRIPKLVIVYVNESDYPVESDLSVPNEYNSFYIKNKRSGLYLTAHSTTASGNVYQSEFTGTANQKWNLEPVGDGYYWIKLADTNFSLDVYCGSTAPTGNTDGANIQTITLGSNDNQKWKFVRNWNGTYQILSKLGYGTRGLAVQNASNTDGANCILYTHNVNFMYNDDWTLEPVNLYYADFFSVVNNIDTTGSMKYACDIAEQMGFEDSYHWTNETAEWALELMQLTNLWYFRGHGLPSYLEFYESVLCVSYNYQNGYYVADLDDNALRNLYLFGSNSCLAGSSGETWHTGQLDLIGMVYRKGAHFAFGTTRTSYTDYNEPWAKHFMDCLLDGKSYYEAIQSADQYVINMALQSGGLAILSDALRTCSRHYAGDSSIVLYHG